MLLRSLPSDSEWLAKITATLEFLARVTAACSVELDVPDADAPCEYCTETPDPAREVIACNGVTVPEEFTPALPPPSVSAPVLASSPSTAIDVTEDVLSGST